MLGYLGPSELGRLLSLVHQLLTLRRGQSDGLDEDKETRSRQAVDKKVCKNDGRDRLNSQSVVERGELNVQLLSPYILPTSIECHTKNLWRPRLDLHKTLTKARL